jgi:hypothetical protein
LSKPGETVNPNRPDRRQGKAMKVPDTRTERLAENREETISAYP